MHQFTDISRVTVLQCPGTGLLFRKSSPLRNPENQSSMTAPINYVDQKGRVDRSEVK